jgi:hypothetical protein
VRGKHGVAEGKGNGELVSGAASLRPSGNERRADEHADHVLVQRGSSGEKGALRGLSTECSQDGDNPDLGARCVKVTKLAVLPSATPIEAGEGRHFGWKPASSSRKRRS